MANASIPGLPVAVTLDGTEQLEVVQPPGSGGTTKRATAAQIAALASINSSASPTPFVVTTAVMGLTQYRILKGQAGGIQITDNGAQSTIVVGVITTGLIVGLGGTGTTSLTANGVLVGNGTSSIGVAVTATSGFILTSTGTATPPTFQAASGAASIAGLSAYANASTVTQVPSAVTGTTNQVLRVAPSGTSLGFGQLNLSSTSAVTGTLNSTTYLSGILSVALGGSGTGTLTANGVLLGNGTSSFGVAVIATSGFVLTSTGTATPPTFQAAGFSSITGLSVVANSSTASQVPSALTGTANQVVVVNPAGTGLIFGQVNLSAAAAVTGSLSTGSLSGIVSVPNGGSGTSSLTSNGIILGSGTAALAVLIASTAGSILITNGTASAPSYSPNPTLGVAGSVRGSLSLTGATGGTFTLRPNTNSSTYSLVVPANGGTANFFLQTDGTGTSTWAAAISPTVTSTLSVGYAETDFNIGNISANSTTALDGTNGAHQIATILGTTSTMVFTAPTKRADFLLVLTNTTVSVGTPTFSGFTQAFTGDSFTTAANKTNWIFVYSANGQTAYMIKNVG